MYLVLGTFKIHTTKKEHWILNNIYVGYLQFKFVFWKLDIKLKILSYIYWKKVRYFINGKISTVSNCILFVSSSKFNCRYCNPKAYDTVCSAICTYNRTCMNIMHIICSGGLGLVLHFFSDNSARKIK